MARPSKPLDMQSKHLTKEELETRLAAEKMLKSEGDKVYKVPSKLDKNTTLCKFFNLSSKKIYKNLVELLKPLNILSDLDIDSLCLVCNALCQMEVAIRDINENGQVIYIKNDNGDITKVMKNPSVETYKTFASLYDSAGAKLCMNPSARAKLSAEIAAVLREEQQLQQEEQKQELSKEESELKWLMGGGK